MAQAKVRRRVVRVLAKGQVTIPNEFREILDIDTETLLSVSVVGDHLEMTPLREGEELRRYTEEDIARFLEEDKLNEETAKKVRELMGLGSL